MEQHIIPLNQGIHLTPSAAEDGQLADCINLVPKDGSLRNAPQLAPVTQIDPTTQEPSQIELATGHTLAFIHTTASFTHYITQSGQSLYLHPNTQTPILTLDSGVTIHEITSIGNTIIVLASDGMHYILWKNDTDGYKNLGTHFPELSISFGLQGEMYRTPWTGEFSGLICSGDYPSGHDIVGLPGNITDSVTEQILGDVNKFLNEQVYSEGCFVEPFFVRYAYRLYDQSLTMHSAPVLMVCSTDAVPLVGIRAWYKENDFVKGFYYKLITVKNKLDYIVNNLADKAALKDWSDIISSVDVFISKPIRSYNQSGKITRLSRTDVDNIGNSLQDNICICKITNQNTTEFPTENTTEGGVTKYGFPLLYQRHTLAEAYVLAFAEKSGNEYTYPGWKVELPQYDTDVVNQSIRDTGNFYLLKSINIDDLATQERTLIPIAKDYLPTLETREVMTDDYQGHDTIIPTKSFIYNSRLNISGISRKLFNGFPANTAIQYEDGYKRLIKPTTYTPAGEQATSGGEKDTDFVPMPAKDVKIFVQIEENGKTFVVESEMSEVGFVWKRNPLYYFTDYRPDVMFFYYPNPNAKKAWVKHIYPYIAPFQYNEFSIPLQRHSTLNGAFYFNGWQDLNPQDCPSPTSPNIISLPNKIYTSEVNNPFHFPASGINTIGTGEIKGICAAVKALSQGQFGQFPLYAFATDGIWALETKDDGTYSVKQPVTRDVCTNPNSIVQTDSAVLYATERGLHLLQGSETKLLTSALEAYTEGRLFTTTSEQGKINIDTTTAGFPEITSSVLATVSLLSQLQTCSISYDGINHIAHIYPAPSQTQPSTHYILHLDSMEWTRTTQPIPSSFIDGYPNATLQIGQALYQYALPSYDNSILRQGFLLTRETALGSPTTHKILKDMRTLKHWYSAASSNHKVRIIPLISNDRLHWYRLTSLHANSAIWYRFAIFTLMADSDMLEALTLITEDRRTNKLR